MGPPLLSFNSGVIYMSELPHRPDGLVVLYIAAVS